MIHVKNVEQIERISSDNVAEISFQRNDQNWTVTVRETNFTFYKNSCDEWIFFLKDHRNTPLNSSQIIPDGRFYSFSRNFF